LVIHKRTRLTPIQNQEIYQVYHGERKKVSDLAEAYHVSRPTIYKILRHGRQRDFSIHKNTNKRFCCLKYGIKRLSKIEREIESRLKSNARRYNKDYPGQTLHGNTKRLPLLKGESTFGRRGYLFVAIDDFSRALYAAILLDKTQNPAKVFLEQVLEECPYTIEQYYTDNGKEYREDPKHHAFMTLYQYRRADTRGKTDPILLSRNTVSNGRLSYILSLYLNLGFAFRVSLG
jgi:hypothetical protein